MKSRSKLFKTTALFLLFALFSCSGKDDMVEEAIAKAVSCSELGTVEYTITKLIKVNDDAFYKFGERKILFSCKTVMKAGIDLKEFTIEDTEISEDGKTITINLPHPKILSFNMAAEDVKLEYAKSTGMRTGFNTDERNDLLKQGEKCIIDDVSNLGVYDNAKQNASDFFQALLAHCGFENINVCFKDVKK